MKIFDKISALLKPFSKKVVKDAPSGASGKGYSGLLSGLALMPPEPNTKNMRDIRPFLFYISKHNILKVSVSIQRIPEFYSYQAGLMAAQPTINIEYLESSAFEREKSARIMELSVSDKMGGQYAARDTRYSQDAMRLLKDAAGMNASDIHLDIIDGTGYLRYRVGGALRYIGELPQSAEIVHTIINTFSELAGTEYVDSKMQDSAISNKDFLPKGIESVRVVTSPRFGGSYMVMRLQYEGVSSEEVKPLSVVLGENGYLPRQVAEWARMTRKTSGIILICGKVGSGKTKTLADLLGCMVQEYPEKLIQTVENPVEIPVPGVRQLSLKTAYGAKDENKDNLLQGIKVGLRSDPNILVVSEVRASEEALTAFQGADTGLLLLTTLHANGGWAGLSRFQSLLPVENVPDPYLHMTDPDFMAGVCYQRLVRVLCDYCKKPLAGNEHRVSKDLLSRIELFCNGDEEMYSSIFIEGDGCAHCGNLGYRGRTVIAEVISFDTKLLSVYNKTRDISAAKQFWLANGGVSYRQVGHQRVLSGMLSPKEYEIHCGDINQRELFDASTMVHDMDEEQQC